MPFDIKKHSGKSFEPVMLECLATINASREENCGPPKFSMVAYTGSRMNVYYYGAIVIDLEGLDAGNGQIPILWRHNHDRIIGHSTAIGVEKDRLSIDGIISFKNEWANQVVESSINGFPWQASVGVEPLEIDEVADGKTVEVNGRKEKGPLYVIRSGRLLETSFVELGADSHTSASVKAEENSNVLNITSNQKESDSMTKNINSNEMAETANAETEASAAVEASNVSKTAGESERENAPVEAESSAETKVPAFDPGAIICQQRNAAVAEMDRIEKIQSKLESGYESLARKAIAEGWTPDKFELEQYRAHKPEAPGVKSSNEGQSRKTLEIIASRAVGIAETSIEANYSDQELTQADKYRGCSIHEFMELACGRSLARPKRDVGGFLEAAFSNTSLPGILSNTANKVLLAGYDSVGEDWKRFCKIGTCTDFKTHYRYRMNSDFKFSKVGRGGELKHGKISETEYTQKIETYGVMFALTRQMIIDDDLGALYDLPYQIGVGAGEAINDGVWTMLMSNAEQADGYNFFSSNHNNLLTGSDSEFGVDGLSLATVKFEDQTKENGRPLGVTPTILLVPSALKVKAFMMVNAANLNYAPSTAPGADINPHQGKFEVVSSPWLSNSNITGYSSTAYYLFASPSRVPAYEVAFLGGQTRPTIERANADFNTLGVEFRGYIDFGMKEQDWRGALKVTGVA